jgi:hypothetical protein
LASGFHNNSLLPPQLRARPWPCACANPPSGALGTRWAGVEKRQGNAMPSRYFTLTLAPLASTTITGGRHLIGH